MNIDHLKDAALVRIVYSITSLTSFTRGIQYVLGHAARMTFINRVSLRCTRILNVLFNLKDVKY